MVRGPGSKHLEDQSGSVVLHGFVVRTISAYKLFQECLYMAIPSKTPPDLVLRTMG